MYNVHTRLKTLMSLSFSEYILRTNHILFYRFRMTIKWVIFLTLLHTIFLDGVICFGNCPVECSCGLDDRGRLQTICNKGILTIIS